MRDLPAGERLGPYEIVGLLGAGGMGKVYRAHDGRLGRDVAIKILAGQRNDGQLRRLEMEARAAGSLNHPNIVAVHDVGTYENEPYIVSELLEGATLRALLEDARVSPAQAAAYGLQLARGLAAAHDKGMVHRDLKPENVFITGDGRLKILDFGIAKVPATKDLANPAAHESPGSAMTRTGTGAILGTVQYMSPEQVRGQPADRRSDIFSLGAVLYEMLAGEPAFTGPSAVEIGYAILNREPRDLPSEVPASTVRIVQRCLRKNPADRFQSAHELALEIERASAPPLSGGPARAARLLVALTLVAVAGLAIVVWRQDRQLAAIVRHKTHADQEIRVVELEMQRESDPGRLASLEDKLRLLVSEAQAAIVEMQSKDRRRAREWNSGGDELERAIRPILKKFDAEAYAIPPIFRERLQRHIDAIARDVPGKLLAWQRRKLYWPAIQHELSAVGLPEEMGYVAWVESRFDPAARSPLGAVGMWQLMPDTARILQLRVDAEVDERLDMEKSTRAAARYLANLLAQYGSESFMLALASYNYGESKLRRELHDLRAYRKEDRDFWRLYRLKRLSQETREYVPLVLAAAVVFSNPERYGLQ